jgi:hypothetical protein
MQIFGASGDFAFAFVLPITAFPRLDAAVRMIKRNI